MTWSNNDFDDLEYMYDVSIEYLDTTHVYYIYL